MGSAQTAAGAVPGEIQVVVLIPPQIALTDLRGQVADATLAAEAAPVKDYLVQAASGSLRRRAPAATLLTPEMIAPRLRGDHEVLARLAAASLDVGYSEKCDPQLLAALVSALGTDPRRTAVMFTTVDARLGYDRTARVPLVLSGDAETHTSLIKSLAFTADSSTAVWANSVFARSRPAIDNPIFQQAVKLLFQPLERNYENYQK